MNVTEIHINHKSFWRDFGMSKSPGIKATVGRQVAWVHLLSRVFVWVNDYSWGGIGM
jgi:hypothetical protein